jgi:hypothetical protein
MRYSEGPPGGGEEKGAADRNDFAEGAAGPTHFPAGRRSQGRFSQKSGACPLVAGMPPQTPLEPEPGGGPAPRIDSHCSYAGEEDWPNRQMAPFTFRYVDPFGSRLVTNG